MSRFTPMLRTGAAVGAIALLASLAACSSDSEGTDDAPQGGDEQVTALQYDGPEAEFPAAFDEPEQQDGFEFTVGWLSPMTANNFVNAIAKAGEARTEALGGKFILKDANNDVNTQVDQCNELIAQNVDAMAVYAVDPSSLGPCLDEAASKGIEIIGQDTPPFAGEDLFPHFLSNVSQGPDRSAFEVATLAAQQVEPGASFATIGVAIPVPLLKYYTERLGYWAEKYGLEFLGNVDAASDTSQDSATAMNDILTRWPDVSAVLTYNGPAALAASTTARASGATDVKVFGAYTEKAVTEKIAAGEIAGTSWVDTEGIGTQMINGLYNAMTDQNMPLPEQLVVVPKGITADNVDSITPIQ
ncbi:sugar ABC transporter substrate-binding protein [Leucobacter sp. USHLN153]|uniref:sugar ABC transporter substrate-binding protein n=1 Tax=Leucobacter sp. USHLN153 TaxID=3081268 RepID=UPI0030184A6A